MLPVFPTYARYAEDNVVILASGQRVVVIDPDNHKILSGNHYFVMKTWEERMEKYHVIVCPVCNKEKLLYDGKRKRKQKTCSISCGRILYIDTKNAKKMV